MHGYQFFLACINFDFLESFLFYKFTFQIINTNTKNEKIIFLVAWFNVDTLIFACNLSIQIVPALPIFKRIIYYSLQIVRIIHHRLRIPFV